MKGTIVAAWIETCRILHGDEVTNEALQHFNISPDKIFKPSEDVDDKVARGIIEFIAEKKGKNPDELWRGMGTQNILTYSKIYPAFFKYRNLYSFLQSMYDIHTVIMKRIPGARPPILSITPVDKHTAHMTYTSPRRMFAYFMGMVEGAAHYFKEDIEIEPIEQKDDTLKIAIKFAEEIYYEKKFLLNKILSFGFFKKLEGKMAIASLVLIGIPASIAMKFLPLNISIPLVLILSAFIPFFIGKGLFRPLGIIKYNLDKLINKDLTLLQSIDSKDFFEEINKMIISMKDSLKADFVGYKAITDELNVFSDEFLEISNNMSFTSQEISNVVEQVANGAVNQAEETSKAAEKLNDSIVSLDEVVKKEEEGKNQLEVAVKKINNSFKDLKATLENLNNVLKEFSQVQSRGEKLQNRAKEVRNIVETVEKIAEQTNLLALNASIEASRAGEYGRGFTVVAMEIRKLAEGSREAVKTINNILESFISDIDSFVSDISQQYSILKDENTRLSSVAKENQDSVNSISEVSDLIIELNNELIRESETIGSISESIESLAAIAEENSASSEEVSANVQSYTEQIQKMVDSIQEFKKVSETFSKELEKYIV
ncbi:MAG TPA: heme NO-binding domain-containing protein [Tissierellaceae bacterium]